MYGTLVCVALGILPQIFIAKIEDITFQEGIAISVLGWIITCLVGTIPYLVWGGEFTLANSLFESVSGFTTTGATILNDVEILPKGLLFWRASTHFIGGIGIILFVLVILPEKKRIRSSIYHSEVSGLSMLNFRMKTKKIVNIIVIVYISLITVETVLLKFFGMNWFDAVCHSFATVATGGFSTKNASVAHYNSISIEIIIMFFMLISSMHFGLVYNTIRGKKLNIFTSNVVRAYVMVFVIGIFLVAAQLASEKIYGPGESIRYAAFQVISLGTTTGFSIVDTPHWPI
ncbi:MAG: potassium transporter TrkG, partial [Dysgonamonadaceae bacterium]